MADVLTRPALAGAIVSFAVWLILASPRRFARASGCLAHVPRARLVAFLAFAAIATVCAQKPGGTNAPPRSAPGLPPDVSAKIAAVNARGAWEDSFWLPGVSELNVYRSGDKLSALAWRRICWGEVN